MKDLIELMVDQLADNLRASGKLTYADMTTGVSPVEAFKAALLEKLSGESTPSSSVIQKATVELTDAQIKALPTTPVEILPAPGAGKAYLYMNGFIRHQHIEGAQYTNIHGTAQLFITQDIDGLDSVFFDETQGNVSTLLSYGDDVVAIPVPAYSAIIIREVAQFINKPMAFKAYNAGNGNFTGGSAENSLSITIYYIVVDI